MADLRDHISPVTPERLMRWRKAELAALVLKLNAENQTLRASVADARIRLTNIRELVGRSFA